MEIAQELRGAYQLALYDAMRLKKSKSTINAKQIDHESISTKALLADRENQYLEFKEMLPSDIAISIAAFLNSEGGNLIIGVDDQGNITGLAGKSSNTGINKFDQYQRSITERLCCAIGSHNVSQYLRFVFEEHSEKDICRIVIMPSGKPIYTREKGHDELYIRTGNSKRRLYGKEAVDYVLTHWSS